MDNIDRSELTPVFKKVFSSSEGAKVMDYLQWFCLRNEAKATNDPYQTYMNLGMEAVCLEIESFLNDKYR